MNIIEALGSDRKYTLHSHTQFCDGRANMEDFIKAAVSSRFTHYGFSPHSPVPIDSPCNMAFEDVPAYLAEIARLRDLYGDRIQIYASMEIDYLGSDWGPSHEYFTSLPLDYRIGSVHFIPAPDGQLIDIDGSAERFRKNMKMHFGDDLRYVIDAFFDASIAMVEAGEFDIIGHFDKVAQNASYYSPGVENSEWFVRRVTELIDVICEKKPVVEINTKAKVKHNRIFPSERYLSRLIDAGVPLIVNSDAHEPQLIDASRDYAFALIDSMTR